MKCTKCGYPHAKPPKCRNCGAEVKEEAEIISTNASGVWTKAEAEEAEALTEEQAEEVVTEAHIEESPKEESPNE